MRVRPPLAVETPFGSKWLRSTWFLRNGSWLKVEDRVGLMGGLNALFGNFILFRLLHRSHLRDHDQFMLGPVMLICNLCWLHV